jgi:hypothetical protein
VHGECRKAGRVNGGGWAERSDDEDTDSLLVERLLRVELAEERGGVSSESFSG